MCTLLKFTLKSSGFPTKQKSITPHLLLLLLLLILLLQISQGAATCEQWSPLPLAICNLLHSMILSTAINPKGINSKANLQHEISTKNVAFGSSFPPKKSSKTTTNKQKKQNTKPNTNPKSKTRRPDFSHTKKKTNKQKIRILFVRCYTNKNRHIVHTNKNKTRFLYIHKLCVMRSPKLTPNKLRHKSFSSQQQQQLYHDILS
jgi:hypothetical protein